MLKIHLKKRVNRSLGGTIVIFMVLVIIAVFMGLPLVFSISNSLKPLSELFIFPPRIIVQSPTLENFSEIFTSLASSWVPFLRYLFNSLFITFVTTFFHIIFASLAAYPLAKMKFRGRTFLFSTVVISLMFVRDVTVVPSFLIFSSTHLLNTPLTLILPSVASGMGLFLMKQFIEAMIHDSLLEAARIDGASEITIWRKVVMPAVKPAWLTLILFSVQGVWNQTGGNLIFDEQRKTLPFAINQISMGGIARAGASAAAVVLMMVVPIAVFLITQSSIMETMSTSGIKE